MINLFLGGFSRKKKGEGEDRACEREKNKKTCKSLPCDLQVPPPSRSGDAPLISREKGRILFLVKVSC